MATLRRDESHTDDKLDMVVVEPPMNGDGRVGIHGLRD